MNGIIENIKKRRSIRAYKEKLIDREILTELIDCARLAPSARNIQPWQFVVVTSKETLSKFSELAVYGRFLKQAAACVVVCGDPSAKYFREDCSAATQNILLAAGNFGICSCWIAGYPKEYTKQVKKLVDVPADLEVFALISLGYPMKEVEPPRKKSLSEVLHWEKF